MVIRKGSEWGTSGHPSDEVPVALDDVHANHLIEKGVREFVISSGDMARTIGATTPGPESNYRRLPIDLMEVSYVDTKGRSGLIHAFSNVRLESTWPTGGFLRGDALILCNAQFLRTLDIAPRGHPNDGKIEYLHFERSLTIRQRLQIVLRSRTGSHLPHPSVHFRQIVSCTEFPSKGRLIVDGRYVCTGRITSVRCIPDALVVWSAGPPEVPIGSTAVV